MGSGCVKITYTSGSTGTPRGVRLSGSTLDDSVQRLVCLLGKLGIRRHLCTMPLATLLENVAGVYVPLALGAAVYAPSVAKLGLYGSELVVYLRRHSLRSLPSLKLVAVGGAKVTQSDLDDAADFGIPAYQGYGLSECASVVALNTPGECKAGSVGRPLPGLDIDIAEDGEIRVTGQAMLGVHDSQLFEGGLEPRVVVIDRVVTQALELVDRSDTVATGDIGYRDADGFLYVTGRKKNVFITSFGRNVAPEWPEALLLHEPEIAQACVFGEAMPANIAVIVPAPSTKAAHVSRAVARANRELPDYARIGDWVLAEEPFGVANGLSTATGKPRRDAIAERYLAGETCVHAMPAPGSNHSATRI